MNSISSFQIFFWWRIKSSLSNLERRTYYRERECLKCRIKSSSLIKSREGFCTQNYIFIFWKYCHHSWTRFFNFWQKMKKFLVLGLGMYLNHHSSYDFQDQGHLPTIPAFAFLHFLLRRKIMCIVIWVL